jgi:hypothetical protein
MKFRKSLLTALCVASLGGLAVPVTASAEVQVYFNMAPRRCAGRRPRATRRLHLGVGVLNAKNNRHYWRPAGNASAGAAITPADLTQHNDRWQLERGR